MKEIANRAVPLYFFHFAVCVLHTAARHHDAPR